MRNTMILLLLMCYLCVSAQPTPISNSALSSHRRFNSTSVYFSNSPSSIANTGNALAVPMNRSYGSAYSASTKVFYSGSRISSNVSTPFSKYTPPVIRYTGGDNDDDDDWGGNGGNTGGNAGDPEPHQFTPIGDSWCMLLFALAFFGLIAYRRRFCYCNNEKTNQNKLISKYENR